MGLHPVAGDTVPNNSTDFPASTEDIKAFAEWWDEQPDAQEAVDAVWGK